VPSDTVNNYKTTLVIFDITVVIVIVIALILGVFVLSNLVNIYVSGKKKEVIVMRINGFSKKQTIRYLAREMIMTMVISLSLAVLLGFIFNDKCISLVESEDMMLIRRFSIKSWGMAILFESVLAFIINWFHFRKVNNMKVSDMNR
jgi:ABC-type antimicrobial peptide transport system permease subunit